MGSFDRINNPISAAELERRWAAVRASMEREEIDVLVMQANNDYMGGYVKYFTDLPATNGYPLSVVFARDDLMTLVQHGAIGTEKTLAAGTDGVVHGVKHILYTASFASAPDTRFYDAELLARALAPFAQGTIGLVGTYAMGASTAEYLRREMGGAKFVDASDLVDRIKAIKSEEEKAMIRQTAALHDGAMAAAFAAFKPGVADREVAAAAAHYSYRHGTEAGIWMVGSYPVGEPVAFGTWHFANRIANAGDMLGLLVECNGPGGQYGELGRSVILGKVTGEIQDEFGLILEARQFTLGLLKPGTPAHVVFAEYNAFMDRIDRPREIRLHAHGQGYDLVERPLIRHDETMTIEKDMQIVCHPAFMGHGVMSWICDDYLIGDDGVNERIHRFPEAIVEIDI